MHGMFDDFKKPNSNDESNIPSNIKPPKPEEHKHPCGPEHGPMVKPPFEKPIDPFKRDKPFEDYNAHGELIGYWWYEGDLVSLEFNIEGEVIVADSNEYVTAEDFVKGKTLTLKLLNFRREEIYSVDYEGNTTITFDINDEIAKMLKKGIYYCSLDLWDGVNFNRKIYSPEDCTFTIK